MADNQSEDPVVSGGDEFADDLPLYQDYDQADEDEPTAEPEADIEAEADTEGSQAPAGVPEPSLTAPVQNAYAQEQSGLFSDDEQKFIRNEFDEDQLRVIELAAQRAFQQGQASILAHQQAMRAMGISDEFAQEYSQELAQATATLPPQVRGTREGAEIAMLAAVRNRALTNGDLGGELLRAGQLLKAKSVQATRQPAPPLERSTTPRPPAPRMRPVRGRADDYMRKAYNLSDTDVALLYDA